MVSLRKKEKKKPWRIEERLKLYQTFREQTESKFYNGKYYQDGFILYLKERESTILVGVIKNRSFKIPFIFKYYKVKEDKWYRFKVKITN